MGLVGNAWAGFGAAFGPLVLLSLYWKGLSRTGAVSGMLSGAIVVIIWIAFVKPLGDVNDFFNLYEIIPGFLTSLIVTVVVSKFTKKPQIDVKADLTDVRRLVKTGEDQKES